MFPSRIGYARRNYLQILSDILKFCQNPQSKTRILHETNTNFKLLGKYLLELQAAGLIAKRRDIYLTTSKGTDFVESWTDLQNMLRCEQTPEMVKARKKIVNNGHWLFVVE
jgi:predicted transcriptional regulator